MRASLYVNGEHRRLQIGVGFKTTLAQLQAVLILTLCPETAVALVAGANLFVVRLFVDVYVGMDFDHCVLPRRSIGQPGCHAD